MTKRNWRATATTAVAVLMGTSLLMSGQAYAASEISHTSTGTYSSEPQQTYIEDSVVDNQESIGTALLPEAAAAYASRTAPAKNSVAADTVSPSSEIADRVISEGLKYRGVPYKFGSSKNTTSTFDCSSFTQRVFKDVGINLPRDSRQQSQVGQKVSKNELQKGDLVFFRSYGSSSSRITHVAIYAGNNTLLHTYGKPGVTTTKFEGTSWEDRFELARRVIS